MPTARSATATAAFGSRIFVAGGEVPQLFSVNEVYDIPTNTWSCQAPMPLPRHGIAAVALDDRILMPAGGVVQGLNPTNLVDAFTPLRLPGDGDGDGDRRGGEHLRALRGNRIRNGHRRRRLPEHPRQLPHHA
jgi:hypothetical protein